MNMMTPTEGMLDIRQSALGNRLERETKRERNASQGLPATARSVKAGIQSAKQELDEVRREQAKLQQAIYEAAQIQRKLCAPRELVWGEFEIAGEIFPVRHLSGDFLKVMELDSALGLTVGDIAGKGLSAGIWQAHLMGLMRRCARKHADPAAAVAEVNAELCQDQDEPPIAALFFARLDPQENELVYCNAGLPAPLLLRQDKAVERLEKGGPMLGALQGAAYDSGSVRLNPGDMLLAYSDGVTECRNSKDEEFEIGRLSAAANAVGGASANQVLFSTLGAVLDFADACSPEDDLTLLVIRRREGNMIERPPSRSKDFSAPRREPTSVVRPKKVERRGNRSK
jgi:serine phosphatase RsbU (regulator of sigma subunit)